MTVWYKQGVIGDLQQVARKGLGRVADLYKGYDEDLFITSIRDSNHKAGSLHYDGLAFDIKSGGGRIEHVRVILGSDWDVVFFKVNKVEYYHCEYDPK